MRASDPIFEIGLTHGRPPAGGPLLAAHARRRWPRTSATRPTVDTRSCAWTRSASGRGGATSGTVPRSARRSTRSAPRARGEAPGGARPRGCLSATRSSSASGPNGLAAAIVLARAGRAWSRCSRARETLGGGCRSAELTLPGFVHDTCSTVHALALASPFLRELPLAEHGLELVHPDAPLAHPLDDGTAVMLERSVERDRGRRSGADARAYRRLFEPLVRDAAAAHARAARAAAPAAPSARDGALRARAALRSAAGLSRSRFEGERARALLAGCCAHSMLPLERAGRARRSGSCSRSARHAVGWPVARGGSQRLADALAAHLRSLGGDDRDRATGGVARRARRRRAPCCSTSRRASSIALAGHRLPGALPPAPRALPLRPGRLQARLGARRADPVDGAGGRARGHACTSAARSTRSPRRSEAVSARRASRAPVRAARAADASSIRRARRRASTRRGRTATCRTARRAT